MPSRVQYLDQFAKLTVSNLYRHLFGPREDRLCRYCPDPPPYQLTWTRGAESVTITSHLIGQKLFIASSMTPEVVQVRFTAYHQGLFGGERLAFLCPDCERRVFSLFVPTPSTLIRPTGDMNRREVLCLHCHGLRYPSTKAEGPSRRRAAINKRRLEEKLGAKPEERLPGVGSTRHQKRLNRYLRACRQVLE